jgi:hypothetical protein
MTPNSTIPNPLAKPHKKEGLSTKGTKDFVSRQVETWNAEASLKAFITAQVAASVAEIMTLDCHWHQSPAGKTVMHLDISPF